MCHGGSPAPQSPREVQEVEAPSSSKEQLHLNPLTPPAEDEGLALQVTICAKPGPVYCFLSQLADLTIPSWTDLPPQRIAQH